MLIDDRLVINNSEIDIFHLTGTFQYLHIENIVSKELNILFAHNFFIHKCKIDNLYYIGDSRHKSSIRISESDIDFLHTGIYTTVVPKFSKINCVMYDISISTIYFDSPEKLSKINCDLQHLQNNAYIINQIVHLPNISKKFVITNINCKSIVIHTNDVEEITFDFDMNHHSHYYNISLGINIELMPIDRFDIIGNPKMIEIPKKIARLVTINNVKLKKQSMYRLRKTAYCMSQYVLNYE